MNRRQDGTNSEAFILVNFCAPDRPDRRNTIRRRNEKIHFLCFELLTSQTRDLIHALLGESGLEKRCIPFLWSFRHGKTSLSADPDRFLIGDDEHGWPSTEFSTLKAVVMRNAST